MQNFFKVIIDEIVRYNPIDVGGFFISLSILSLFFSALYWISKKFVFNRLPFSKNIKTVLGKFLSFVIVTQITIISFEISAKSEKSFFNITIGKIQIVLFVFSVTWLLLKVISEYESSKITKKTKEANYHDRTTIRAVAKLLRAFVVILATIVIFQALGLHVSGIVTVAGIGTAAIGFAAKDLIANFFGTVLIYMDKPFVEGDWISSPEKKIEGDVEEIGWRITKIMTFEKRPIYVPNSVFASAIIQNNSRMTSRRIKKTLKLRYKDISCIGKIAEEVDHLISTHQDIEQNFIKFIKFTNFADFAVDLDLYVFTNKTKLVEFYSMQQELLLEIDKIIKKNGADFAFPTTTIDYPDSGN